MIQNVGLIIKSVVLLCLILSYNFIKVNPKEHSETKFNIIENNIIKDNPKKTYEKKNTGLLRQTAAECTLFLNVNNEFPIDKPCSVLLLGSGARNTIKGGTGSGDIDSEFTTCEEGLENAGFKITSKDWLDQNEYQLLKKHDKVKADIAIYVLSRISGQGMDRETKEGDVLLKDSEIKDILFLNEKYQKFILVLNVCGVVDLSPIRKVSNILLLSQLGAVTGDILADIILGKQNPSGKLATTWSMLDDYKFIDDFGEDDDTNYVEGVYVGYRYFNSAGIKPIYPFGYGKSYTSFDISKVSLTNKKDKISIKVKIKNKGKFCGKEVIQIYVSPSQNNEDKPYQSLVSFKKTSDLKPLNEEELNLEFKLRNVARYDPKKACYILDKGNYIIRVGNSSENTKIYGYIELNEDIITEKLRNINKNYKTGFKDFKPKIVLKDKLKGIQKIKLTKKDFEIKEIKYNYKCKINDKLLNIKNNDLAYMCLGDYSDFKEKESGITGLTAKNVEEIKNYLRMSDGPAGLRLTNIFSEKKSRKQTTAIPIATALAQTFNTDLIEKIGDLIGNEMEIYNIHLWLAPALNIHRNILCGRNFEYFSEDPLVSGKMAAAMTKGVQSHKNKGTTIKHFAANNQEKNKYNNNSNMSERALREIYLKGFQIAIEESHPHAIMTSYNLLNGIHTSENKDLLINVLRNEWKFNGLIMSDWSVSEFSGRRNSKYPAQNIFGIIKGGNNLMMPGSDIDYNIIIENLNNKLLSRNDLLSCASKVYETIELLNN